MVESRPGQDINTDKGCREPFSDPINVLFLCHGNSVLSPMAQALLNTLGEHRYRAYSAGARPAGGIHPLALEILQRHQLPTSTLRSKSWQDYAGDGDPPMDLVITLCSRSEAEICPVWPGAPLQVRWHVYDPATAPPDAATQRQAFLRAYDDLYGRIRRLSTVPVRELDHRSRLERIREIGLPHGEDLFHPR